VEKGKEKENGSYLITKTTDGNSGVRLVYALHLSAVEVCAMRLKSFPQC
jgi:hypothetical protein